VDGNCNSVYVTATFINKVKTGNDSLSGHYGDVFWGIRRDSANFLDQPGNIIKNAPDSMCASAPSFSVKVNSVPGAQQYSWQLIPKRAGSISGNDSTALVNIDSTYYGNLKIICRASSGCSVSDPSDTLRIFIRQVPATPFISANGFLLSTNAVAQTYNWYNSNGLAYSTSDNYFGASFNGYYYLRTENDGCLSEPSNGILLWITEMVDARQGNKIQMASDEAGNLRLINWENEKINSLEILNIYGQRIYETREPGDLNKGILQGLSSSVYIVRLMDAKGGIQSFRFIKR